MIIKLVASFWFRAVLSVSILSYLVTSLDWRGAVEATVAVDGHYLLAAVLADLSARTTMISRWVLLLRSTGSTISIWSTARIFLISSFIGMALPTGGADVTRAYAVSRRVANGSTAIASVAVDRLLGVAALLTLGIVGLALSPPHEARVFSTLLIGLCAVTAVILGVSFSADRIIRFILPAIVQRTPAGTWLTAVSDGIAHYRKRRWILAVVFVQSLLVQGLRIVEVFLLGSGLGLNIDLNYYLMFMPIGLLALMLPISIAGIGLPQGVIVWLLRPAGVPDSSSFALSILIIMLGVLGTLPGLYLYLRPRRGVR